MTDCFIALILLERFDRLGLGDFGPAVFASAALIVIPKIEHGLAEMIDDIGAIEIDVFHEGAAVVAVKNDVLVFAGWPASLHDDTNRIGRANRSVRDIRWNEKSFTFADEMIDDLVALADPDFDVALQLVKIFFRIDEVEIVPGVWAFDDHDEKVAAVVEITIADRRLKQIAVSLDPIVDVDRRQDLGRRAGAD
jgi:hypothetical protein